MSQNNRIIGATILLMGVAFLSKIIGFVREVFIAAQFGISQQADIFVTVSKIPTLVLTISGGALAAALVPLLIKLRTEHDESRLNKLTGRMFTLTGLLMLGFALLLGFFAKQFVDVYVLGFNDEAKALTVQLIRIILPAIVAIGLISLFAAVLNAHHHFFVPSLGPLFYSAGVIIATIFFSARYGVKSLVIGMVIGFLLQLLVILAQVIKQGVVIKPLLGIDEDIKQVGKLILPILIGVGAFQVNTIVDQMMASTLVEGSLAALNYANRITQLPISIFVGSMVLPLLPAIAEKIAAKDLAGTVQLLSKSHRLLGILLLPVIGLFVGLGEPLITMVFQRGEFDVQATQTTSLALAFYAFTILPFAMRDVMTRALYSLQDTWTPVVNSILLVAVNVILMLIFVPRFGMIAIAGSTSISSIFGYWRLRSKLNKKLAIQSKKAEGIIWLKIWFNAILFTIVSWGSYQLLYLIWQNPTGLELWLRTLISLSLGAGLYIYLVLRLKTSEVTWIKERITRGKFLTKKGSD